MQQIASCALRTVTLPVVSIGEAFVTVGGGLGWFGTS